MRPERWALVAAVLLEACDDGSGDSRDAPETLADRIVGTTWTCEWLVLMANAEDVTHTFPVEVEHTLSIGGSALNDDLPYRLVDWARATEDGYRDTAAYSAGFTMGREVQYTMDDVAWRQTGNDEIMFATLNTVDQWAGNAFMTFDWSGDGVWVGTSQSFGARSWCVPAAP